MESQTMKHSHSILAQLVLPMQANPAGNVHGGEIMKMMDSAAGVAGRSSMEVFVTVESEDLITGNKQIALTAFFTMVSLDENGKPSPVPKLVYDENNAYESKLYKVGEKKHILHNERKS